MVLLDELRQTERRADNFLSETAAGPHGRARPSTPDSGLPDSMRTTAKPERSLAPILPGLRRHEVAVGGTEDTGLR